MPTLKQRDFQQLLSRYVDGDLEGDALRDFESYLKEHPDAARELEAYKRMQNVLAGQSNLPPDVAFWRKLSERLEQRAEERENLLPFPRKYVPAVVGFASVALVAIGVVLYTQKGSIFNFLNQTTQEVQTVFQDNLLKGTIVPLFAGIDRDHALQYALFGTLPLDDESNRALRVDETSAQGYTIEMGSTIKEKRPRVTVQDLVDEVGPTLHQSEAIDSVLDDARRQIESSAFSAENNAIAIDPELTKLNRATLFSIASVLEPKQRVKFDTFLKKHGSSYVVDVGEKGVPWQVRPHPNPPPVARTGEIVPRAYVVMTPDTFVYTQLEVDLKQFQMQRKEMVRLRQERDKDIDRLVESLHQVREPRRRVVDAGDEPIVVQGGSGFMSIQIHGALVAGPEDSALQVITRSPDQFKIFRHELDDGGTGMVFEYRMHISGSMDSLVEAEMTRAREAQHQVRQQDSILKAQQRSGGVYLAPSDTVRRKRMF
jgi:hypothetical protein